MTRHDDLLYLGHMLDAARKVVARTEGVAKAHFDANEDLQIVLTHLLQTIGEAARRVSPDGHSALPEVPWPEIIAMRHRLVHDYTNVNPDIIWQVAIEDLPPLIEALTRFVPADPAE